MSKEKSALKKNQLESAIRGIKGIAHPDRLQILFFLSQKEHSVGELVDLLGISQSAASQHLSKMKINGILSSTKESNQVFYYLKDGKYKDLIRTIIKIYG